MYPILDSSSPHCRCQPELNLQGQNLLFEMLRADCYFVYLDLIFLGHFSLTFLADFHMEHTSLASSFTGSLAINCRVDAALDIEVRQI
jgi:hypothetical protein